jgi:hypothetical protein
MGYTRPVAIRCELCGRVSPDRSALCECGYDFRTGEVNAAITLAEREVDLAQRSIGRGIWLLCAAPVSLLIGVGIAIEAGTLVPLVPIVLVALACGIGGLASLASGAADRVRSGRTLRQAKERKQLPAARTVR